MGRKRKHITPKGIPMKMKEKDFKSIMRLNFTNDFANHRLLGMVKKHKKTKKKKLFIDTHFTLVNILLHFSLLKTLFLP